MILPFNLNTTTQTKAKGEKFEYIQPGSHECEITGISTSEQLEDYKGSPFIDFKVKSNQKIGKCRFWAVKESDKPSTKEWKTKTLKDFLINAGVRDFSDDSNAMNDAIGKSLMIAFISEEYIGVNRETQEPVIRTAIKYRWSAKKGGKCTYNQNMNQTLSDVDMADFSTRHSEWSKANSAVNNTEEDEDMPF
tara:strand:- start:1474 stop:2049 length:576 start_codon:yes stop_codon:yes gene_type:complete